MVRHNGHDIKRKKGDWPKTTENPIEVYTKEEMQKFFAACVEDERLLFQVFLCTGFRDQAVAHLMRSDVDYRLSRIRVAAKPPYKFNPKSYEIRSVNVPRSLLDSLKKRQKGSQNLRVFPSAPHPARKACGGGIDKHLLETCKEIALRAGLNCGHCSGTYTVKRSKAKKETLAEATDLSKLPWTVVVTLTYAACSVEGLRSRLPVDRAENSKAPMTQAERQLVLMELETILSSSHFRSSKRYPALLKYLVEKTLDGDSAELKERLLGIVVFDRRPDYDTTADPVVRVSAGEVRKRIAQYYHERGEESALQISLPLGSYIPEFKFRDSPLDPNPAAAPRPAQTSPLAVELRREAISAATPAVAEPIRSAAPSHRIRSALIAVSTALLLSAIGLLVLHKSWKSTSSDGLWEPTLQSPGIVLIVVGNGHPELTTAPPPQTSLIDYMLSPYNHISLSSAIAISSITGALQERNHSYEIKDDTSTSLQDLQGRPVILIGAMNNRWTEMLTQSLRYRFATRPIAHIEDSLHPQNLDWGVDNSKPYTTISTDYAILARYHDQITNSPVLIVAGLGPWANEAASQFASSPRGLAQLNNKLPPGWESKNIEVVLKTAVIEQEPGPASVVAVHLW